MPTFNRVLVAAGYDYEPGGYIFDPIAGKFRLWWSSGRKGDPVKAMHADSADSVVWSAPTIVGSDDSWGRTVVDEQVPGPQRFKNVRWFSDTLGARAAVSPDGLSWSYTGPNPMLPVSSYADVWDLWKNPLDGSYGQFSRPTPTFPRRTVVHKSTTFPVVTTPVQAFYVDALDVPTSSPYGGTQFYGASNPVLLGNVLVSFCRVLRDDVTSGSGIQSTRGIGYTVLAWSRDGLNWSRSREPFLEGVRGSWDEAIAWVYGAVVKDGILYLSYTGYDLGHKAGATPSAAGTRNVGIASMPFVDLTLED